MLIVWGMGYIQNNLTILNFYLLPFLAVLFLALAILLWHRIVRLRIFELAIYGIVLGYGLSEFISVVVSILQTRGMFNPNFTLWIPFIYILSFLFLDTNRALLISAIYFFITLMLGLVACMYFFVKGWAFVNFTLLVQIYFASIFYISILYLVARIKERYNTERAVADDMSKLAMTDPLTQIHNRLLLNRLLREEINRTERYKVPLSVLIFDLDYFKKINDTLGHNMGDIILREVAQLLRQHIRTSDPFGRWGGDEFLCIATNTDGQQAVELSERLQSALHGNHFTEGCKVTASFGVTTYQFGDSPESLVRRADLGLYKAKAEGRDRVEVVLAGRTLPLFEGEKPYPVPEDNDNDDEAYEA
jgi:diguanylate cyclase